MDQVGFTFFILIICICYTLGLIVGYYIGKHEEKEKKKRGAA